MREEATLRLNQLIVEVRTRIEEVRSYHEQHQEEVRQQFKATTEALMLEEEARKKEDFVLKKDFDQHSGNFHADRGERSMADQQATNRFVLLESQLREEAMLRADTERAFQKDLLDLQARLQAEQAVREEVDSKLDQRINAEVDTREDSVVRETKNREDADAATNEAWQRCLREEQSLRERDRKDLANMVQLLQGQLQHEHEELMDSKSVMKKETREMEAVVTKVMSLVREETQKREEALDRHERARRDAHSQAVDSYNLALREERRFREKEITRLESSTRAMPVMAAKPGAVSDASPGGQEVMSRGYSGGLSSSLSDTQVMNLQIENRTMQQTMRDLQERLSATELRQKSCEERTLNMLDTITAGLMSPES
jgi:hypothetical protein